MFSFILFSLLRNVYLKCNFSIFMMMPLHMHQTLQQMCDLTQHVRHYYHLTTLLASKNTLQILVNLKAYCNKNWINYFCVAIDQYGFSEADTDISAIHGPIPIFPKFLNLVFCFIVKNMMYFMPYLFFKTLKIRIYKLEFLKLQQFQYLSSLTC